MRNKRAYGLLLSAMLSFASVTYAAGAKVFFITPQNGASVTTPVKVQFGVEGMQVKPAGVMEKGTGHFHVIIDGAPLPQGKMIPFDAQHLHYGKGQTEAEIPLSTGTHTLTLQFADGAHQAYGPELSQTIRVHVR